MATKIVVGYDGSEDAKHALAVAIEWAQRSVDGEIVVACSQERPVPGMGVAGMQFGVEEMYDKLTALIEEQLLEAAKVCEAAGVKVATLCGRDAPEEILANAAEEIGAEMIVIGFRGAGTRAGRHNRLGSTTIKVLQEVAGRVPILVV